jgi:hypothetical protein
MPAPVLTVAANVACTHGAPAMIVPSTPRVLVAGSPVAVLTDTTTVVGCPFVVVLKPQPCVLVRWMVGAARVFASGQPLLLQTSTGLCFSADQIPAGPPIVGGTQPRVLAT